MSNYRIIYPNDAVGIAVVSPAQGIAQTEALRAVPAGKPYLVIDVADIPEDQTFRDAWQADFTDAPVKD